MPGSVRWRDVVRLAAFVGAGALIVIGLRFLFWPASAAWFFGMAEPAPGTFAYHHAIALRDLWVGALLWVLAWREDWRGIALWFALAAPVCFGDAAIASASSSRIGSIAFHIGSGIASVAVAAAAWRVAIREVGRAAGGLRAR